MASRCMSASALGCVDSTVRRPVRATYTNLYKWPESDAEFVKSVSGGGGRRQHPRVVDSYSCRQMYLRSYTFSRKESVPEKTRKCLGKVKDKVFDAVHGRSKAAGEGSEDGEMRKKKKKFPSGVKKLKEVSCSALYSVFRRLLACTATVNVVEDHRAL